MISKNNNIIFHYINNTKFLRNRCLCVFIIIIQSKVMPGTTHAHDFLMLLNFLNLLIYVYKNIVTFMLDRINKCFSLYMYLYNV